MTIEPPGGQFLVYEFYNMPSICIGERGDAWDRVLLAN
jgi:hypothetical protein